MITVNSREFAENPIHYLNLSRKIDVAIRRGKVLYKINPEPINYQNPSPSGDTFWDDPNNHAKLEKVRNMSEEENPIVAILKTDEDIDNYLRKFLD